MVVMWYVGVMVYWCDGVDIKLNLFAEHTVGPKLDQACKKMGFRIKFVPAYFTFLLSTNNVVVSIFYILLSREIKIQAL